MTIRFDSGESQPVTQARFLFACTPLALETIESYSRRVLKRNFELPRHRAEMTREWLAAFPGIGAADAWVATLEWRTGLDLSGLAKAGQHEIRHDGQACDVCASRVGPRFACRLCSDDEIVEQQPHLGSFVCAGHNLWIGPGSAATSRLLSDEVLEADRRLQNLLADGVLGAGAYLELARICEAWAPTRHERHRPDTAGFITLTHLAAAITDPAFQTVFFDPNRCYDEAYALLHGLIEGLTDFKPRKLAEMLWVRYRPIFLAIREHITGDREFNRDQLHHELPHAVVPDVLTGMNHRLEPFEGYLAASGSRSITKSTWREILAPSVPHDATWTSEVPTICVKGHRTQRSLQGMHRYAEKQRRDNCGVCRNRCLAPGINDLATTHPHYAARFHPTRNMRVPDTGEIVLTACDVFAGSGVTYWWICETDPTHEWKATASNITSAESGCPLCLNRVIIPAINDLPTISPAAATHWDYDRNKAWDIHAMSPTSKNRVTWSCAMGHTYKEEVFKFVNRGRCRGCAREEVTAPSMLANARPTIAARWHPTLNGDVTPRDKSIGSSYTAYWLCERGHTDRLEIYKVVAGYGCRVCSNRTLVPGINDARTRYPDICAEWHPHLNGTKWPQKVLPGTDLYWWRCSSNNHNLQASIPHRVLSGGCTDCSREERARPGTRPRHERRQ